MPAGSLLINTINAHSYNVACKDKEFAAALQKSDVLLPDGISVVWATRLLTGLKINKIAGADLFEYEMERLNKPASQTKTATDTPYFAKNTGMERVASVRERRSKALFIGSTEATLQKIKDRAGKEYPGVELYSYSPPYKPEFSVEDNAAIYAYINTIQPDVIFIGMTAPKQEKWAARLVDSSRLTVESKERKEQEVDTINYPLPSNCHVCCIGAVFDFYAGTVRRAPRWMIQLGLEWFYRLLKEPRRMWKRYLVGNLIFVLSIIRERMS